VTLALAALFAGVSDPGGEFGYRASRMGLCAVIGALLTGLAFAIGEKAWELLVLAAFVVTVLAGLSVKYGLHRYMAGYVLNCWFIIAIGLPASYKLDRYTSHTWAQMLAWVAGCALWVAIAGIGWLARGRGSRPQPIRDPWGQSAARADPADHCVLGDPGAHGVDRGRDRLRAASPERLLDADRDDRRDEVKP
jgi:hypothetical protein